MGGSFPKRRRLRKRREFLWVQQCSVSQKLHAQHFLVIAAPRYASEVATQGVENDGRVGITVSKRVGNAVVRNRLKRWVREFVRRHLAWLPGGCDVVIIAKRGAAELRGYAAVESDLSRLERRLRSC